MTGEAPPDLERVGVAATALAFSSLGWAFRSQEVKDYGIDAHVEPFDGPHRPIERLLVLQIKAWVDAALASSRVAPGLIQHVSTSAWYRFAVAMHSAILGLRLSGLRRTGSARFRTIGKSTDGERLWRTFSSAIGQMIWRKSPG